MNPITRFWTDESGVTAIEYGLIATLIAVVIVGSVRTTGDSVSDAFKSVSMSGGGN